MRNQLSRLRTYAVTAVMGLASLILPANTGCTSYQPTTDQYGRITGSHEEFDAGRTLSLFGIITSGVGIGLNLSGLTAADSATNRALSCAKTFGSLVRNAKKPTAQAISGGKPYGYDDLEQKVKYAFFRPEDLLASFGREDISQEKPLEVERMRQFVGKWKGESIMKPNGALFPVRAQVEQECREICDGWLIVSKSEIKESKIQVTIEGICGWDEKERVYRALSLGECYCITKGKRTELSKSFGEGITGYNEKTDTWEGTLAAISNKGYFIISQSTSRMNGEEITSESKDGLGTGHEKLRRVK